MARCSLPPHLHLLLEINLSFRARTRHSREIVPFPRIRSVLAPCPLPASLSMVNQVSGQCLGPGANISLSDALVGKRDHVAF